ncbi:MAG: 23S rRNA (guanosine(2251)-2'-O)-methyltransferase RlmB [Bacilli bacterium]|nr:23S rRNA (guanosine(2251)-2'-O)-methyltransferase RlmB [Bacilli bacterium]
MIIVGKNPIVEAIRNKRNISKLIVAENLKDQSFLKLLKDNRLKYEVLPQHVITKKYGDKNGGIVAEIIEYDYATLDEVLRKTSKKQDGGVLMILDGLEDPHNLGAILRSADATGADAIIIPKNRSVSLNQTVAKVSTGAIEYVDVVQVTNLTQTIQELKKNGYWVIGLELDGTIDFKQQDYHGNIAVVVGSEGKGISRLVKENCDILVKIPMYGKVNSLNASVSAGLILYEIVRNRKA